MRLKLEKYAHGFGLLALQLSSEPIEAYWSTCLVDLLKQSYNNPTET